MMTLHAETAPNGEMVPFPMQIRWPANQIQSLCLPEDGYFPHEMYFRGNAVIQHKRHAIAIPAGGAVSLDTYFNLFPLFKWLHYTRLSDLRMQITVQGKGTFRLYGIDQMRPDEEILIQQWRIDSDDRTEEITWECEELFSLSDFLFIKADADEADGLTIYGADFFTSAPIDDRLNLACCFCTYKREAEIRKNVENLLNGIVHKPESIIYDRLQIYIADNGQTLPLDLYENELAVHLFYNKNYGGSAGFTRCMIESCFRSEGRPFSHIIVMDDDALILPEVVERTGAFIGLLKTEYSGYMLGGALLSKEVPYLQQENGVFIDADRWVLTKCGWNLDLRDRAQAIRHETADAAALNCNGWWYTCIPVSFITEENLPLPMFLHLDDGEYGYRNDGRFIRLNGVCVWHPSASGLTKIKAYMGFYNSRNAMIFQASYCPEKSRKAIFAYMARMVSGSVFNYKYLYAQRCIDGYEMFYRGIDAFQAADAEQLNRQIMSGGNFEKCYMTTDEMLALKKGALQSEAPGSRKRKVKKFLNWLVPAYKGSMLYDETVTWDDIDFFAARQVYIVDTQTGEGIVLKKSYREALKVLLHFMKFTLRTWSRHDVVYREWHSRILELETYDFWKRYLEI